VSRDQKITSGRPSIGSLTIPISVLGSRAILCDANSGKPHPHKLTPINILYTRNFWNGALSIGELSKQVTLG